MAKKFTLSNSKKLIADLKDGFSQLYALSKEKEVEFITISCMGTGEGMAEVPPNYDYETSKICINTIVQEFCKLYGVVTEDGTSAKIEKVKRWVAAETKRFNNVLEPKTLHTLLSLVPRSCAIGQAVTCRPSSVLSLKTSASRPGPQVLSDTVPSRLKKAPKEIQRIVHTPAIAAFPQPPAEAKRNVRSGPRRLGHPREPNLKVSRSSAPSPDAKSRTTPSTKVVRSGATQSSTTPLHGTKSRTTPPTKVVRSEVTRTSASSPDAKSCTTLPTKVVRPGAAESSTAPLHGAKSRTTTPRHAKSEVTTPSCATHSRLSQSQIAHAQRIAKSRRIQVVDDLEKESPAALNRPSLSPTTLSRPPKSRNSSSRATPYFPVGLAFQRTPMPRPQTSALPLREPPRKLTGSGKLNTSISVHPPLAPKPANYDLIQLLNKRRTVPAELSRLVVWQSFGNPGEVQLPRAPPSSPVASIASN